MSHKRLQQMLTRRHELSTSEEAVLHVHLASCELCRRLADEYSRDDQSLMLLAQDHPPLGLRQAVLSQAGRRAAPKPGRFRLAVPALAAAIVFLILGVSMYRTTWPFSSSDHILSKPQAVRAALVHTVIGPRRSVPADVRVTARLGSYAGDSTAWLVTISGTGVSVLSPEALVGQLNASTPTILHRETTVINGHTGAFVETYTASG